MAEGFGGFQKTCLCSPWVLFFWLKGPHRVLQGLTIKFTKVIPLASDGKGFVKGRKTLEEPYKNPRKLRKSLETPWKTL